nr:sugar transferase [uncultured Fibrobacter sp.]
MYSKISFILHKYTLISCRSQGVWHKNAKFAYTALIPSPVGCPQSPKKLYLPNMYARFLKRPLDFCCALAAILALSPLLLVLTVLGAVKMHGNPFFTQPRPGKGERIFRLVKFRTMTNERDAQGNLLPDDVRLNAYGKFLRSTSLDFFLLGGPALPRRHALFYGPASRLCHPAHLVKPSLAPRVLSPRGHDRCRETLMEAA